MLLVLFVFHVCVGSPCSTCTASLSQSRPRRRRLLRRCHTASTRRSLHCRSRRTIAPPRTYGAWNAAAVTLAGHGGGGLRALRARLLLPPAMTGFTTFPFFPARPPFQGQGFPPQVVSRRGLPRRGTPLVPLPCLIYCHGFHISLPEGRVSDSTCRWREENASMSRRGLASGRILALRLCAPCTELYSGGSGVPASLGRMHFN